MRKLLAILLVILGFAGIALGIYGRTSVSAATNVTAKATISNGGAYVVIDPGVLTLGDGKMALVKVAGAPGATVGVYSGLASDVNGFVGDSKSAHVTGLADWQTPTVKIANPQGPATGPNPALSDNWVTVASGKGTLSVTPKVPNPGIGPTALLIAVDGIAPAPTEISLSWSLATQTSWINLALGLGSLLLFVGAILLIVVKRRVRIEQREAEHTRKLSEAAAKAGMFDEALVRDEPEVDEPGNHSEEPSASFEPRKREGLR